MLERPRSNYNVRTPAKLEKTVDFLVAAGFKALQFNYDGLSGRNRVSRSIFEPSSNTQVGFDEQV